MPHLKEQHVNYLDLLDIDDDEEDSGLGLKLNCVTSNDVTQEQLHSNKAESDLVDDGFFESLM
jgi:hypothetical protein